MLDHSSLFSYALLLCVSFQSKPTGAPSTPAPAPCCQSSKVSSAAAGDSVGVVLGEPKQMKETGLPCETAAEGKTQSVKRGAVAQGGLFRKARGVCRTFDRPAHTPSSNAVATCVRKATTRQRTTTTLQKSKLTGHRPSAMQTDRDEVTPATHKGACHTEVS